MPPKIGPKVAPGIREDVRELLQELRDSNPSNRSANMLYRAAQAKAIERGMNEPYRREVEQFLAPDPKHQVYSKPVNPWPGRIKKPTETDTIFDVDTLDLHTKTAHVPAQMDSFGTPYQYLAMMQDRFFPQGLREAPRG